MAPKLCNLVLAFYSLLHHGPCQPGGAADLAFGAKYMIDAMASSRETVCGASGFRDAAGVSRPFEIEGGGGGVLIIMATPPEA